MIRITLFSYIGGTVENATNEFIAPAASNLIYGIEEIALTCIALYITVMGYSVITGAITAPAKTLFKQCLKITLIAAFALNADTYKDQVVAAFNGLENGLAEALSTKSAETTGSIYETLDNLLTKGFEIAAKCLQRADEAGFNLGPAFSWLLTAAVISLGTLFFALIGGTNIIIAKFSLAIMFALGPLFIFCLMFPVTAKFFDSWFGQVMNYIFTAVILTMIMTFGISAFNYFVSDVQMSGDGVENPYIAGLQILGLTLALGWIAYQANGMAAGLAGGISMNALTLRHLLPEPPKPTNKPRLSPIAEPRNTVSPVKTAGNTTWKPAYRQYLQENLGRTSGGNVKNVKGA